MSDEPQWSELQLSQDEAILFAESKAWEPMTHRQRAEFQLYQHRLCMPFDVFQEAIEKSLGRGVWTHEFALNYAGLQRELRGEVGAPSMQEIVEMIPGEKRIVVMLEDDDE